MTVLQGEPQYKIRELVADFLGRSRNVIHEMGEQIEPLLRVMAAEFDAFRERNMMILLDGVRFEWVRWTPEGVLIEFSVGAILPQVNPADRERHAVIDDYVDGIVGASIPEGLRAEFAGFLRGIVMQFGLLKKHNNISLREFTFGRPRWVNDRVMRFEVKWKGRPFVPGLVRID